MSERFSPAPSVAALGEAIRRRRLALGLEQDETARIAGVVPAELDRIERGLEPIRLEWLVPLSFALDISLNALMPSPPPEAADFNRLCRQSDALLGIYRVIRESVEKRRC